MPSRPLIKILYGALFQVLVPSVGALCGVASLPPAICGGRLCLWASVFTLCWPMVMYGMKGTMIPTGVCD